MDSLTAEFDQSWAVNAQYSLETGDDSGGLLWELRSPEAIALEMLEASIYHWTHYGWAYSLNIAIAPSFIDKDRCQQLSTEILENAPPGIEAVYPKLRQWAQGNFKDYNRIQEFVDQTQPAWLNRMSQASPKSPQLTRASENNSVAG